MNDPTRKDTLERRLEQSKRLLKDRKRSDYQNSASAF